ncbi:MAG: hypothetical protein JWM11_1592 [Planctomycetaceae bacterium]|nr:hypothetical protein [Planctomycetaceae bacterium]
MGKLTAICRAIHCVALINKCRANHKECFQAVFIKIDITTIGEASGSPINCNLSVPPCRIYETGHMLEFGFPSLLALYCLVVASMSILSIFMYADDKQRAKLGDRRIREKTLQLVAFLGGWPGAIYAQQRFRHKTKKLSFQFEFWTLVLLHLMSVGLVIFISSDWSHLRLGLKDREQASAFNSHQPAQNESPQHTPQSQMRVISGKEPEIKSLQQQRQKEPRREIRYRD